MAPQTSYLAEPAIALAGLITDNGPRIVRSGRSEGAARLPYGIAVAKGTADGGFIVPATGAAKIIGILGFSHVLNTLGIGAQTQPIGQGDIVNVLAQGSIEVLVEEAVTPDDPVYVRFADGIADATKTQKGSFRKSADTNTARLVRGARYLTTALAGAFARVEFDALSEAAVTSGIVHGVIVATTGAEGAVAANAFDVVCQLVDASGNPIAEAREVMIRSLAVTDAKGALAAAGTAVGTVKKAFTPATGENVLWMETTAGGLFSFRCTDDQVEAVGVEITAEGCRPKVLKLTFA
jgi:hypothetical protein